MAETRDAQIALLEERLARLERILDAQAARITQLEAENAELRARLNKNSQNSSKPPSSDGPQVSRSQGKPSHKPRGGQPGHKGAKRVRLKPDEVVDHRPQNCRHCARQLEGDAPDPKWFQVFELPEIKPIVTEHRGHSLTCGHCGTLNEASLPDSALLHGFGPRISAFVAYLTGRCRLSKRQVVELLEKALGTPISTGAVCAIEQDASAALAKPVEEAMAAVQEQPVAHLDETDRRLSASKEWSQRTTWLSARCDRPCSGERTRSETIRRPARGSARAY